MRTVCVIVSTPLTIPIIWNGNMFGDLDISKRVARFGSDLVILGAQSEALKVKTQLCVAYYEISSEFD